MKKLEKFGVAGIDFNEKVTARGYTYTTKDDRLFSTPLIFPGNPYNEDVKNAKVILDVGCGVGRNLEWVMENTNAVYIGLDPNSSMIKYFWECNEKYRYDSSKRIFLVRDFDELAWSTKENNLSEIDVVICTFVFQHIGFRPTESQMNISDITQEATKYCRDGAVWVMYEHDGEENWIQRWMDDLPRKTIGTYIRDYAGIPELTHRGLHHLIVWKVVK